MTMNVTITNEGPACYITQVKTFDKNYAQEGNPYVLANTQDLKMGESTKVAIHSSRYLAVSEIDAPKTAE